MEMATWPTGRLLSTAARLNEQHENERLTAHGITNAGLTLLQVVGARNPISQARLAELLHIKPQTAGKTLERLELRGLVQRVRDQPDRRLMMVELTAAGRHILETMTAEEKKFDESTGLSEPQLRAALENVITALRPQPSPTTKKPGPELLSAIR